MPSPIAEGSGSKGATAALVGPQHTHGSLIGIAVPANVNRMRAKLPAVHAPGDHRVRIAEIGILRHFHPEHHRVRLVLGDAGKSRARVEVAIEAQVSLAAAG